MAALIKHTQKRLLVTCSLSSNGLSLLVGRMQGLTACCSSPLTLASASQVLILLFGWGSHSNLQRWTLSRLHYSDTAPFSPGSAFCDHHELETVMHMHAASSVQKKSWGSEERLLPALTALMGA